MLGSVLRQFSVFARTALRFRLFGRRAVGHAGQALDCAQVAGTRLEAATQPQLYDAQAGLVDNDILAAFLADRTFDRAKRVLSIFVRELSEKLTRLNESIRSQDVATLRAVVHSARGSSMLVGAALLAGESQRLEHQILDSELPDWVAAARLATIMDDTLALYSALLARDLMGIARHPEPVTCVS